MGTVTGVVKIGRKNEYLTSMPQMFVHLEGESSYVFFKEIPLPRYRVLFYLEGEDESLFCSDRQFPWITIVRKSDVTMIYTRGLGLCLSMRFFMTTEKLLFERVRGILSSSKKIRHMQ